MVQVSTDAATGVGTIHASLNGTLDDLEGAASAEVYFEWGASGGSLPNTTEKQTLSSAIAFDVDVDSLSQSSSYDFRAVADASDGTSDTGSTLTFSTGSLQETTPLLPGEIVKSGSVTLSSGSASIDTGVASSTTATFFVAIGPTTADAEVAADIRDDSGTSTYQVDIQETDTSVGNPTVEYDVIRVR
jgi:hypothetical protein